jgi:hypothetical protein
MLALVCQKSWRILLQALLKKWRYDNVSIEATPLGDMFGLPALYGI